MSRKKSRVKKYRFYRLKIEGGLLSLNKSIDKYNENKIKKDEIKTAKKEIKEKENLIDYYKRKKRIKLIFYMLLFILILGILIGVIYWSVRSING